MEAQSHRLPLVIGVTGHRDLRDQDVRELEQTISAIIAELRRDYLGNDAATPIVVLSALAEGADRLAARVALREGARLVAPMPMPVDEYRRDFDPGLQPGNSAEFDKLLAQAVAVPVMPFTPGNSLEAVRADHKKRAEQYRAVGVFIARQSHLLLALWDGDEKDQAAGGTAEVVIFKRRGTLRGAPSASLDRDEAGPVIHIVTPRNKASSLTDKVEVKPWGRAITMRASGGIAGRLFGWLWRLLGLKGTAESADRELWERFDAVVRLLRQFNQKENGGSARPDKPWQKRALEIASRWSGSGR